MAKAHIVNHTHWDREWYFTVMDSQVLADQVFTEILDELDTHAEANFCLDGQTSILDEYVATHPEELNRIKKLVKENRLFVGPWYTQTDALIPDAESILRNLTIGITEAKEKYGKAMMVGYLPDTFGFNAQMPMLLNQAGIDSIVFWRGTNFDTQVVSPYFNWHSLSKDSVIAANFPYGYFTGQIGIDAKEKMESFVNDRYDPAIDFLKTHGENDDILMPSGIDQMNIVHNMAKTVGDINVKSKHTTSISSYQKFIDILKTKDLPDYSGELRLPTYARVHRTIGSVRQSIKKQNFEIEQKILKRVEPLMVIAESVGIKIGKGMLNLLWKKVLECQAHDSLGGSVSDNVAEDINHRFKEANELADGIENFIKKKIADFLNLNEDEILLFNTDLHDFEGTKQVNVMSRCENIKFRGIKHQVINLEKYYPVRKHVLRMTEKGREYFDEPKYFELKCTLDVHIPAFGYKVLKFEKDNENNEEVEAKSNHNISVDKMKFELVENKVRFTNDGSVYDDFIALVEAGNDGDTYDYSPIREEIEKILSFTDSRSSEDGLFKKLILKGSTQLPQTLEKRIDGKKDTEFKYELTICINKISKNVFFKLNFNNNIDSHRLRLRINPNSDIANVKTGIQGGFVNVSNLEVDPEWEEKFDEKPVNIYNFDKLLNIKSRDCSFSLYPKGLKEFEFDKKYLYITLLATTGQLGKPNLAWRPGRASGDTTNEGHIMMPTPLAQEHGEWSFEIGMTLDDLEESNRVLAENINMIFDESVSYQKQSLNLFTNRLDNKIWPTELVSDIPRSISILKIASELIVSAVYPSKDDGQFLIRLFNPLSESIDVAGKIPERFVRTDILENEILENSIVRGSSYATFKGNVPINFKKKDLDL